MNNELIEKIKKSFNNDTNFERFPDFITDIHFPCFKGLAPNSEIRFQFPLRCWLAKMDVEKALCFKHWKLLLKEVHILKNGFRQELILFLKNQDLHSGIPIIVQKLKRMCKY